MSASSSGGSTIGAVRHPSSRTLCLCAGSAAAVGVVVWLAWPRRARATREEALLALERFRAECAAAMVDIAATVARVGVRDSPRGAAPGPPDGDEAPGKVRQAIEQPLVLQAALSEAAVRAAATLPSGSNSADDLEEVLQRYRHDPQVQQATEEVRTLHTACLESAGADVALPAACAAGAWSADEVLEVLKELGAAKAGRLQALVDGAGAEGALATEGLALGAYAVRACAEAEDEVWERLFPGDRGRRCGFAAALERLSSSDGRFRQRRAEAEGELEALAAGPAATAAAIQMPLA